MYGWKILVGLLSPVRLSRRSAKHDKYWFLRWTVTKRPKLDRTRRRRITVTVQCTSHKLDVVQSVWNTRVGGGGLFFSAHAGGERAKRVLRSRYTTTHTVAARRRYRHPVCRIPAVGARAASYFWSPRCARRTATRCRRTISSRTWATVGCLWTRTGSAGPRPPLHRGRPARPRPPLARSCAPSPCSRWPYDLSSGRPCGTRSAPPAPPRTSRRPTLRAIRHRPLRPVRIDKIAL